MAETNGNEAAYATRREARAALKARSGARPMDRAEAAALAVPTTTEPAARASAAPPKRPIKRFANIFVLVAAAGIVGTIAIPAYAFNPASQGQAAVGSSVIDTMKKANAQSADVADTASAPSAAHEAFAATSTDEIAAKAAAAKLAAQRAAAAAAAAKRAATYLAAYNGPTAAQYLANPPYPNFNLGQVFSVAQQYTGTPYVYGGSTPAGFDCSGFVMFVYAQFGISLPHSASAQGHIGATISVNDAVPGDIIALNDGSHDGFFAGRDAAGNVLILDAPRAGGSVGIRPIWTSSYHIQRFGIG